MEKKLPKFYVALLEGGDVQSALPIVAVNDPTLVKLVIDYLTKRVEPREPQTKQEAK